MKSAVIGQSTYELVQTSDGQYKTYRDNSDNKTLFIVLCLK